MTILVGCAVAAVLMVFTYTLGMFLEGMRARPATRAGRRPRVVFLVPCLNEERVIGGTLRRLTADARWDDVILVIDDGSDDRTAAVVADFPDLRVHLLHRELPQARQGKGAALNHAVAALPEGVDPARTVVCLMDADGRLDPGALEAALSCFGDPGVCAVQTTVRIVNRSDGVLARLQDMEFVVYSHIFQRTRGRLGSAGLGGNGQFVRLSALRALGPEPWTDGLTEDLELGIRLVLNDGRTTSLTGASVHQQGVVRLRRLVRQRSRWFQGHLQAWRLIPDIRRAARGRVALDLLHILLSPLLIFVGSFMTLSLLASVVGACFSAAAREQLLQPVPLVSWYVLTFAPALLFGPLYARATGEFGIVKGLAYGHVFIVYGLVWLVAGWGGVGRALSGRHAWLKTERLADEDGDPPEVPDRPTAGTGPQRAL
jgi:cellulose synthase/poly-beta-1,6-N-acetylglucosamine synthase-like glycosyltransferase